MISFTLDRNSRIPYYKQLVMQVEAAIKQDLLKEGEILPSMNVLAAGLDLSKETVKKAYSILRDRSLIDSRHGKGFYVRKIEKGQLLRVLIICDVHSIYKQILVGALQKQLSKFEGCDTTLLLHNQDVSLLRYYLDRNLDSYDWYLVVPHFPLDEATQKEALHQLKRIPNRKLILLDHWMKELPGNYGAVYQDFSSDPLNALLEASEAFEDKKRLNVICLKSSLYKDCITESLRRFAKERKIKMVCNANKPKDVCPGDVCVILSSQHDFGLVALADAMNRQNLQIGKDVFIICYNDFPLNGLVLGGLTTLSTDFEKMGETAAKMIISGHLSKIHNPFRLIRRNTF